MAPDAHHVIFSRTLQTAELEEQAHRVRIAYLQLLGFLAHADCLQTTFFNLVEIGLVGQLKPYDVAGFCIFALKGVSCIWFVLTIFIHAHHAHVVVVVQVLLYCLPEARFYGIIHFATGIAIDENGVFGGLRHVDYTLRLTPRVKLGSHVAGGLLKTQADGFTVAQTQFVAHDLPLGRHHIPVCWRHSQHAASRSRVREVNLLAADGIVAHGVIYACEASAVGVKLGVLPCLAIVPLGVGLARHVGIPVANYLAVNACCRIVLFV